MDSRTPIDSAAVLLAEDDDDLRLALADLIHSEGYQVVVACDRETVRASLREHRFHAAILDAHLQEGPVGAELAREIHASDPDATVVLMTGDEAVTAPAGTQLLAKPFGTRRLLDLLRRPTALPPA